MNITETEASSIPSLFLSFASHVDHVTLRNSCFCSWRVKGLRSENSRYTAFQKRCVCLLVANRPPQGKRHSRKKSGRTGCHADPFTAEWAMLQKAGGRPPRVPFTAGWEQGHRLCAICTKGQIPPSEHGHPGQGNQASLRGITFD